MFSPCLRIVSIYDRMMQKFRAPNTVRKHPEIFCFNFGMRIACSAVLFVNETCRSIAKRQISSLWRFRNSSGLAKG